MAKESATVTARDDIFLRFEQQVEFGASKMILSLIRIFLLVNREIFIKVLNRCFKYLLPLKEKNDFRQGIINF